VLDAGGHQVSTSTTQLQGTSGRISGTLDGTVQVVVGALAVFTIQVYVTDANGGKSNTLSTEFQVVAAASMAAVVTATGPSPSSLTVSNGTLYWLESGEDALKSVAVGGGTAHVVATRMVYPSSMAFSGSDVIWSDYRPSGVPSCPSAAPDHLLKRTSASGVTTVVAIGSACHRDRWCHRDGDLLQWRAGRQAEPRPRAARVLGGDDVAPACPSDHRKCPPLTY
jgi:hypothetical protein